MDFSPPPEGLSQKPVKPELPGGTASLFAPAGEQHTLGLQGKFGRIGTGFAWYRRACACGKLEGGSFSETVSQPLGGLKGADGLEARGGRLHQEVSKPPLKIDRRTVPT